MSYSLYNPFLFSAFLDPRTFKGDEPSGGNDDGPSDAPPPTVYENDYSDPSNPKLDTDPKTPGAQTSGTNSQKIESGDTVSQLALDNNTTIEQIKKDNPGIDINDIKAGETINITSNTRNDGESIYKGATQAELDAGNAKSDNKTSTSTSTSTSTTPASTSNAGLTTTTLPNGKEVYLDEGGEFVGFVPDASQQGTRSDDVDSTLVDHYGWTMGADGDAYATPEAAAKADEALEYKQKLESAGESDVSGLDAVAATDVDYTDVKNTNTVASTDDYNDTVVVPKPVSQTPVTYDTTSSGDDYTEAATSDTSESLTDYTDVVTDDTQYETYEGKPVKVKYLDSGIYANSPVKYYVDAETGAWVANAPKEQTVAGSSSSGRDVDADLGIGGSEATVTASELLNEDIDSDNITTYATPGGGGVTLSDDNTTALDQIISGDQTASTIVGGGNSTPTPTPATTDPIAGYSGLSQKEFIAEADAVVVPFSEMTPEQAEVLGLSDIYKPGDMVLPQDLDTLKGAGYTVSDVVDEPVASYDAFGNEYATAEEAAKADIDMGVGIGETSSYTPTISSSSVGSRPGYDYASTSGQVAYTGTGGSEVDKYDPRNIMPTADQLTIASGTGQEPVDKTPSFLEAVTGTDLSLSEIARGLGFDTVGGFFNEASLRAKGTGDMADDALNALAKLSVIPEAQTYLNPEYAENLRNLDEMNALDRLALEKEALDKGVSVASLLDPSISAETGEAIPISLSEGTEFVSAADKLGIEGDITVASDAVKDLVSMLDKKSQDALDARGDEYVNAIALQMPDPDNEGYNKAGDPITPGLWMASVAAQELMGLGMDVLSVLALGPVAGGALVAQQGVAEAGRAAGDEVVEEMEKLRAQGAFDNMSDEDYNEMVSGAEKQAFYTSGIAGGAVDTLTALTAGGFAPLAKALPNALRSGLIASGVVTAEGVSGGLEQVGVNAAVIKALEDQGIDPSDYDKEMLDKVLTAAIYEVVGGSTSGAAAGVGSYVNNLSSNNDTTPEGNLSSRLDQDYFSVESTGSGETLLNEMNKEGSNISVVGNNEKNETGGYDEYTLIDNNTGKTETVTAAEFNTSQEGESGAVAGGVGGAGAKKKQLILGGTSVDTVVNRQGEDVEVVTITDESGNTTVTVGGTTQIVSGGENSVVTDPQTGVSVNVDATNTGSITSTAGLVNEIAAETNTDASTLLTGGTINVSVADPFADVATDVATDVVTDVATDAVTDAVSDISVGSVIDADEPGVPYTPPPTSGPSTPPTSYTPDSSPAPVGENAAGYTSGIAGIGGVRPTVAPRYQSRSVGQYTPYRPESGVQKTPTGPVSTPPSTYLAETVQGGMRYGNPYILPNADPELLAQLARLQGTGDARFPAEYLLDDEELV